MWWTASYPTAAKFRYFHTTSLNGPERVIEGESGKRRVYQVWDTLEGRVYRFNIVIALEGDGDYQTLVFKGRNRAITRAELSDGLRVGGLTDVRWLTPEESGYYQPIVMAWRRKG